MIEFSLSKLNLLIFVTAVAAIVIFFITSFNSSLKTRQSYEIVYRIGKEIKTGIENESYCTVKFINIPKTVQTNSGTSDAFNMRYKLNVSAYNLGNDAKKLVLSIMDRKEKPKIYAAYDIDYNGSIALYESKSCTSDFPNCTISQSQSSVSNSVSVDFDPSKRDSIDTQILFAKIISNGKPFIFLIPCLEKNGIYTCRHFLITEDPPLKTMIPCLNIITDLVNETGSTSSNQNIDTPVAT